MAVYEGVLHKISGGKVISSEGTGVRITHNVGIIRAHKTGVDRQAGFTQRMFVDIGEVRLKNVMLAPYHDELLQDALGEEIALSIVEPNATNDKRHTVVAIRTPRHGVSRPPRRVLLLGSVFMVFKYWLAALIIAVVLAVVAGIVARLTFDGVFWLGLVVAIAVGVWWMILPFLKSRRTFRAAAALS